MWRIGMLVGIVVALAAPASAAARVTVSPPEVPAASETRLDVRVPNDRGKSPITRVVVQLPAGFISLTTEEVDGWTARIEKKPLEQPVQGDEGQQVTDQVDTVTFTARNGGIQPSHFRDFGLAVGIPTQAQAGTAFTFPVTQTDANGDSVRWIGPAGSPNAAPEVKLTTPVGQTPVPPPPKDKTGKGWGIFALLVALGALVLAFLAFRRARRALADGGEDDDDGNGNGGNEGDSDGDGKDED